MLPRRGCPFCRRWFHPHPRLKERQKTCGRAECCREQKRRFNQKWRNEHPGYFCEKLLIQKDLIDSFDHMPLESFDRFILQVHLNKLAKTRSKDRVLQMRAYVRDIFAEAVEQDFLVKDPARKVTVPSVA